MERNNDIYITRKMVYQGESEDLHNALAVIGGYDYENHRSLNEIMERTPEFQYSWTTDTQPISIAELRKHLDAAENAGATHVQIAYHCDHIVYNIDGLVIRESTEEEVDIVLEADTHFDETQRAIGKLNEQIRELKEKHNEKYKDDKFYSI